MSPVRLAGLGLIGISLFSYGAYRLWNRPPHETVVRPPQPAEPAPVPEPHTSPAIAAEQQAILEPVAFTRFVDFGRIPLGAPSSRRFFVSSNSSVEVEIVGPEEKTPFQVEETTLRLESAVSRGVPITFNPERAGSYEARVMLRFGSPVDQEFEVVVRGQGILSPGDVGIEIPPPPDLAQRKHREEEIARLLDEAYALTVENKEAVTEQSVDGSDPIDARREAPSPAAAENEGRQDSGFPPAQAQFVVMAFGVRQDAAADPNDIPAPIPEGETTPDLPPPEEEPAPEPSESVSEEDLDEGRLQDEPGDQEPDPKTTPSFTIAPNSSILVFSSKEFLTLQTLPGTASEDGGAFRLDGRLKFPYLALAFGRTIDLKQWGDLQGTVGPDGSIQINIVLRLEDPNRSVVLDLPISLTTGMAVGYSAAGRVMFANGVPRDPVTGDLKLVGITNIPVGEGSSLDRAPVYLEILGRLSL